jgi:polyhydroxybutyrate depolymerase
MFLAGGAASAVQQPSGSLPTRPALTPGDHTFELTSGGLRRRYIVHVPHGMTNGPFPMMLALHGGGGNAQQFKDENGLDAVAEQGRFFAVYPDGTGPLAGRLLTWNAGTNCCGWAKDHDVNDVQFLADVVSDLARRAPVDLHRIYVTGHSNGAIMAYRLAAERSDLVAAIVPVSGAMAVASFAPTRHVAVLDIHSVDDPRALYDGGIGPPFPGTDNRVNHMPVLAGLSAWARANGCGDSLYPGNTRQGTGSNRGQTVTRLQYRGCAPDGPVEHLRLTGVGHGWPGARARPLMRGILGPATTIINASEEAWRFAARFVR